MNHIYKKSDGKCYRIIPFYLNDDPFSTKGNYFLTLKNLKPYFDSLKKSTYLYFKENEIVGLKPDFVKALDTARGIAGVPFRITSGYRTPEHNEEVGGMPNSAHTQGLAVDLNCQDNTSRTGILRGLLTCGTPMFIEICSKHIHCDVFPAYHKLGDTMWAQDE